MIVGVGLTLTACGDDGNDRAANAEQATRPAAELRASATTQPEPVPTAASDPADGAVAPTTVTPATSPAVEPTGVVVPVVALDNSFRPATVTINVGDEVLWENRGLNDHNVLSIEGDDWGQEVEGFGPGAAYARVFTEPGEYRYYCSIHGNEDVGMVGMIIVQG